MSIAFMIHLFSSHCVVIHLELCCVATRRRWRWHSRCPRCGRCGRFSCAMPASRRVRTTHPMPRWSHMVAAVLVESALVCSCLLLSAFVCLQTCICVVWPRSRHARTSVVAPLSPASDHSTGGSRVCPAGGAIALSEALPQCGALTALDLSCNAVGDKGAIAIAQAALQEGGGLTSLSLASQCPAAEVVGTAEGTIVPLSPPPIPVRPTPSTCTEPADRSSRRPRKATRFASAGMMADRRSQTA